MPSCGSCGRLLVVEVVRDVDLLTCECGTVTLVDGSGVVDRQMQQLAEAIDELEKEDALAATSE